jgi:hypothetical protein
MARLLPKPVPGFEVDWQAKDWKQQLDRQEAAMAALEAKADAKSCVGHVIAFGVADGGAHYLIVKEKPLTLQHIPYCDAYRADPILLRGLRLADVQRMVGRERALGAIKLARGRT